MNLDQQQPMKMYKYTKIGHCTQVFPTFGTRFGWPLAVVDRWSLFRGSFSTNFVRGRFGVVVVDRWSLFRGGSQHKFDCM
jgi:hypothetical protein